MVGADGSMAPTFAFLRGLLCPGAQRSTWDTRDAHLGVGARAFKGPETGATTLRGADTPILLFFCPCPGPGELLWFLAALPLGFLGSLI